MNGDSMHAICLESTVNGQGLIQEGLGSEEMGKLFFKVYGVQSLMSSSWVRSQNTSPILLPSERHSTRHSTGRVPYDPQAGSGLAPPPQDSLPTIVFLLPVSNHPRLGSGSSIN